MPPIDETTIEQAEQIAGLPLSPEERTLILPTYRAWVEAANELSRKLATPEHLSLTPSVRFMHGQAEEVEP
jgi:hypothetical protein